MRRFFGYVRVSTAKQGEQGVSLQEQREAILRHVQRQGLELADWFEERETAAKRGRPVFTKMLRLLRQGKVDGVVIHKIDRSARNLKDWADLGELIDQGIEVQFANESLDLHSRGGRLSADIQAVVAADYIRNLREETRKGFYGRLKQGLYPMGAPLGYLDAGKGKAKTIDPVRGPLVRAAFELYATRRFTLDTLLEELHRRGLRNRQGGPLSRNGLSRLLNNPFYMGVIRLLRTDERFAGVHEPLVNVRLFEHVQDVLKGRQVTRVFGPGARFRRLLKCRQCGHWLTGERQKGHVYYRCHTKACGPVCVREEIVEAAILRSLERLRLSESEQRYFAAEVSVLREGAAEDERKEKQALVLRRDQIESRLQRLTDVFLDGALERELFDERKAALLVERREVEEKLKGTDANNRPLADRLAEIFELSKSAWLSYKSANDEEKRELVETLTSNRIVDGKNVLIELRNPFRIIADREGVTGGSPNRDGVRTFKRLIMHILAG